jgi:nucleotide-binding universal stress UspA family protein
MYDRIVLAVDGSEEATHAARRGLELAREFDAAVDVLYVVERGWLGFASSDRHERRLRERGEAALAAVEEVAAEVGHAVATELAEGDPATRVDEYATRQGADLVVVGRQGKTGLGRRLLGGVTERLLRRSDVPVFVVPGEARGSGEDEEEAGWARVLVTTDGSENAAAATPHGVALARTGGAELHVLNVVDPQTAGGPFDAGGLDREFLDRLEARGQEAVDGVAETAGDLAPELPVHSTVERAPARGGAAAGVREYVATNGIDVVVMASRGRSALGRGLLGSVASSVLRTVDVPVLVVAPSA